jgi:protein-S-isoprenylcysteine O-methyltransferase Ste14
MRLSTLAIGGVFVAAVFFGLPQAFVVLNEALDWPKLAPVRAVGWGLVGAGILIHAATSGQFRRAGGTPVPVEPPDRLVRTGLFRWSRNPIYVADLIVLVGIFALRGHVALLLYVALFWGALHLWLLLHEEPVLRARFGAEWEAYAARVPRWLVVR